MKHAIILCCLLLVFFSCDKKQPLDTQSNNDGCVITEEEARQIAEEFQGISNKIWGEPAKVSYADKFFYFQYETPPDETFNQEENTKVIWVNCQTGEVGFTTRDSM